MQFNFNNDRPNETSQFSLQSTRDNTFIGQPNTIGNQEMIEEEIETSEKTVISHRQPVTCNTKAGNSQQFKRLTIN